MKKFTEWVGAIREAEEKQMSELQKSYKDYFGAKLNKFNAKSPADLTEEQKKEFFNEIKKDWEIGTGAKPAGKKDVEEHGVKESLNEGDQEEQIKKECITKLSQFFGVNPSNLSKFKFDGKDNIKELTKVLGSTSDEGTEHIYRVAVTVAKSNLGVKESEEVNEAKKQITIKFTKSNQHEVSTYVFSRLENDKLVDTGNNGPDYMDLKFDAKNYDKVIDTLRRCDAIDSIDESEEVNEDVINEAVATPEELASFIQKEEKHFAAFLKPKKLTATVNGKVVTIKPGSGSFTITVDYAKSTIDTTGKPEWPESTSYVELMEYIKITKFKLNESEEVNEGRTKADLEDSLKTLEDKLRKYKGVRQNSIHPFDPQKKVSDYVAYLETSIKYVKAEMEGLTESTYINEAEVKNAKDFEEYAMAILKKQHGDDFDEAKAKKTVSGLTAAAEKDGDWGAAVGKLQNA